jgi:hypothetical protein
MVLMLGKTVGLVVELTAPAASGLPRTADPPIAPAFPELSAEEYVAAEVAWTPPPR